MGTDIKIYHKEKAGYPERLKNLPDMPGVLHVIGGLPEDKIPALAIVGARECSSYGKNMAYQIGKMLGRAGIQVISGMARGVDAAAHAGALAGGGRSYAILGCGVDICYPASSRKIYEQMKQKGGVISEFPEGSPPLAYHFPMRNRLISGLADGVLIIEAREKSGSLITADFALEQGRTVFALPGRTGDVLSTGCNRLIYQGAIPVWHPGVLLEEMNWREQEAGESGRKQEEEKFGLAREDNLVYSCLDLNPKSLTELQEETGLSTDRLLMAILHLENGGLAREIWKNHYIRTVSKDEGSQGEI